MSKKRCDICRRDNILLECSLYDQCGTNRLRGMEGDKPLKAKSVTSTVKNARWRFMWKRTVYGCRIIQTV